MGPLSRGYGNGAYVLLSTIIIMSMHVLQELKAPAGLAMARE